MDRSGLYRVVWFFSFFLGLAVPILSQARAYELSISDDPAIEVTGTPYLVLPGTPGRMQVQATVLCSLALTESPPRSLTILKVG